MNHTRKVMAVGLAVCMLVLPISDANVLLNAKSIPTPGLMKQQVERWGLGAKVKVKLQDGKKLRGSIAEIVEQGFTLEGKRQGSAMRIAYADVAGVELARRSYRAAGQPDTAEARRVVEALGVGKHIMVKTTLGIEYHGHIQGIEQDQFTIVPDHQKSPVHIAFNEVVHVEQNLSNRAQWMIIIGVLVGVVVTVLIIKAAIESN